MIAICYSLFVMRYSLFALWHLCFIFIKYFRMAFAVVVTRVKRNNCILFMTCLNVFKLKSVFSPGQLSELLFLLISLFFSFHILIVLRPRTVICFYDVISKLLFFFLPQRKSWLTNVFKSWIRWLKLLLTCCFFVVVLTVRLHICTKQ